jgi:hypothetical protein
MFDEDGMMPGLKGIPNHQGDVLIREARHIIDGGESTSLVAAS